MYFLKNYKINFKNFIYRKINKNFKNKSTLRFSPEPNNYIHIGHYKNILLNIDISKIFNGEFLIRIDDTNNKNSKYKYINDIKKNLKNIKNILKFKFIKKINFSSKNFNKLYQYLKYFIKKNLKNLKKFKNGFNKKKKKIIIYKKIFLKSILYKINYKKHIKTKKNWYIYPLYNYSQPILDKIYNICYSLCTLEFQKFKNLYKIFINLIYKNLKTIQIESNKLNFKKNLTSKKKLIFLKKKNFIKNFKDFRILTIKSLINKNLKIKNLIYFFKNNSLNKKNKNINYNILEKNIYKNSYFNKKNLNLIKNPILIILINYNNINFKKIYLKKFFLIEKNILIKNLKFFLNLNNYLNFKEKLILKIIGFKKNKIGFVKKFFSNFYIILIKKNFYKNIIWININYNIKIKKLFIRNILNRIKKEINFKSFKKINYIIKIINIKNIKTKNFYINKKKEKIIILKNIKLYNISTLNDSNV